jgi:lysozyme
MKAVEIAAVLVRHFEGRRLAPYLCGGRRWTIGYGATRDDGGVPVTSRTMPITADQAERWLVRDLTVAAIAVDRTLGMPLAEHERAALISFVFNLGEGNFGRSTLLKRLVERNFRAAMSELERWNRADGAVSDGLVRRRETERLVFEGMPVVEAIAEGERRHERRLAARKGAA